MSDPATKQTVELYLHGFADGIAGIDTGISARSFDPEVLMVYYKTFSTV